MAAKVSVQQLIANPDRIIDLADEAKDLAYHHGIIMRTHETPNSSEVVTYVPFTLFPSPLPKAAFFQALAVQTHFNTLVDKISQDPDFLEEALAGTIQADDFTAKLFGIYRQVQREGRTQSIVVGLNRSDYMVDQMEDGTSSLKQIEINTIAAGGFGLCDHLPVVHRHTLRSVGLLEESERLLGSTSGTAGMCAALIKGWELYGQQKAVILFLVEDVQISKLTHCCLERELWKRNIPFIRKKFGEVSSRASLDDDKKLFINGLEVAVVYYRYGYRPDHYTEQAWDARLLMERSRAVKCPDISTHLAGTKKVQQVLARPGVLEKFFPDQPQVVEQIRATFTGLYTLDMGPEGDKTVEMALAAPDQFVLKPQREGGGNNIYGSDICQVLQRVKGSTERMAYILMDKIHPAPVQNYLLRRDAPLQITDCLSELGVLGAYVSGTLLWNLPEVLSFHWKYDTAGCCVLPFTSVMMAMKELLQGLITDPDRLKNLADEAKELALRHGIIIRTHENPNSSEVVTYVPFTLFPSPLPKTAFHQALALQTHFNTLVDKISQDPDFLGEALAGTIQADDFTARLFDIYRQVQQEDQTQSIVVGLTRSDYMVEDGTSSLELLEINTVAVSAYATSASLPVVHRHILRSVGLLEESERLLDTTNRTAGMCAALAKGWELYGQQKAVILFLVEEVQISRFNHRCMERELQRRNIPFIRRKFAEVSSRASLDDDKKLFIDGLEVAVVYYRYGYMPDHYTEQDWDTRLLMERSQAAKCPDISTHLAGTKKIQQVLARPGVLEKFFPDQPQVVEQIRATFTGLYTLDTGPEGDKTVEMALAAPDRFVLKPQREGGGNNIYGSEICQVLQRVKGSTERMAYILMDKIHPAPVQNYLLRRDAPLQITDCLSELGVLGAYVRRGKDMVMNECAGHLMKTKSSEHSDGGVAAGVAVLDNPLLF